MKKRFFLVLICLFIGITIFAGGSRNNTTTSGGEPSYTIMVATWIPEPPTPSTPMWQALNKLAGAYLDLQFIPADSYEERLSVSIASGDFPHTFCVLNPKGGPFVTAAQAGMFWELSNLISRSTNISQYIDQPLLRNAAIDGKNYFIPRTRVSTRTSFVYRKDWLAKLNLKVPETLDDIYNTMRAFATRDPAGTGRTTYGMITSGINGIWGFNIPLVAVGGGQNWVIENNQMIPTFMTSAHFDMLKFYKRLYDERLINQDFATIRPEQCFELLNAEQGGMYFSNADEVATRFSPLLAAKQAVNPNIQLEDLWDWVQIKAPDGSIRIPGGIGFYGGFVFPKTSMKTEAELQRLFNIFDIFDSDAGRNLLNWGVEGPDYEMRNGKAFRSNDLTWPQNVNAFQQLAISLVTTPGTLQGVNPPIFERYTAENIYNQRYALMDMSYPFISQTATERGTELSNIINDAMVQYIMGQINDAQYQAAIDRWRSSGGQLVMNEFTQAWRAAQ